MFNFHRSVTWVVGNLLFGVVLVISHADSSKAADETTIKAGDTVVVTAKTAELKIAKQVVAKVLKGQRCKAEEVQGDWFWTHVIVDGKRKSGWLHSRHVKRVVLTSPMDANAFWAWAQKKDAAQAYRCFVYHYPDGPRAAKAKDRWAELDFQKLVIRDDDKNNWYHLRDGLSPSWRSSCRRFLHLHRNSRFAAQVLEEYRALKRSVKTSETNSSLSPLAERSRSILVDALKSPDHEVQRATAASLDRFADSQLVPALIAAMGDLSVYARLSTAQTLGRIADARATNALIEAAYLKPDDHVFDPFVVGSSLRTTVADALVNIGTSHAVDALVATRFESRLPMDIGILSEVDDPRAGKVLLFLLKHDHPRYRYNFQRHSVHTLARIGDNRTVDALLDVLTDTGENLDRREGAASALGEIGNPRAVKALISALEDSEPEFRASAAEALGQIGDPHAVNALLIAVEDSRRFVRSSAAGALGEIGDPRALDALLAAMKGPDSIPFAAASALSQFDDPSVVDALLVALRDSNRFARSTVANALVAIGSRRAVDGLLMALKDSDSDVRNVVVEALGEVDDLRVVNALRETLEDVDPKVQQRAALLLGRMGDPSAVPQLLIALKDSNESVRAKVVKALGEIGDARAVDGLAMALRDSDGYVRSSAANALVAIGDRRVTDALWRILQDSNSEIQQLAAFSLARIGDPRAVSPLLIALKNPERTVRSAAVKGLGRIGDPGTVDGLLSALKDLDKTVRSPAVEALGQIDDPRARDGLFVALKDSEKWIRYAAAEALGNIALKDGDLSRLRAALHDPGERVRQGAAKALALVSRKRYELLSGKIRKPQKAPNESSEAAPLRGNDLLDQIRAAGSRVTAGDKQAVEKLRQALNSSSIDAQIDAIPGLVQAGQKDPELLDELKKTLTTSANPTVRLKITGELAKAKDTDALKELQQYLKSEDPVERIYAGEVLGQSGQHGVADELVAALDDTNPLVRVHAATAIIQILDAQAAAANESEKNTNKTAPTSNDRE